MLPLVESRETIPEKVYIICGPIDHPNWVSHVPTSMIPGSEESTIFDSDLATLHQLHCLNKGGLHFFTLFTQVQYDAYMKRLEGGQMETLGSDGW
ncbi:hypothetical protein A2960_01830 [Candidatus Gottesmanbacteria bacterium RIFCSPLOWO2_01_FULL_39_12b]|uniref:Uncharacterized protein n=1 Tax=Candidatus Gottesmanbacteria bacterium RIFCSPLOWO2_01_FULL_39_12b TaxID=1798388 RepID=A0A1F6AQD7_9BACT|nr:MAG: hypothetical protein A2960_01830 [Candidatus Gottesmanbacteria bacterium RIFCSPLOWO2_01_FULL_39_12b]